MEECGNCMIHSRGFSRKTVLVTGASGDIGRGIALAFGALGLSGLLHNRKYGLQIGYVVGVLGRFVFSTLSGVVFFGAYAPEGMNPWVYSSLYQGSYLGAEGIITLMILSLPPVTKALETIKRQAL